MMLQKSLKSSLKWQHIQKDHTAIYQNCKLMSPVLGNGINSGLDCICFFKNECKLSEEIL